MTSFSPFPPGDYRLVNAHVPVCLLDPGLDKPVDLERCADREAATGVLPGGRLIAVEPLV